MWIPSTLCRVADADTTIQGMAGNDNGEVFADEKTMVSLAENREPWILLDFLLIIIISVMFNLIIAATTTVNVNPIQDVVGDESIGTKKPESGD